MQPHVNLMYDDYVGLSQADFCKASVAAQLNPTELKPT